MKLVINSFAGDGIFGKERLILKATEDLDLGDYVVFCSETFPDGGVVSGRQSAYWFPDEQIKQNDLVVLYTKKGISSKKTLSNERTAHFFYWGEKENRWSAEGYGVVVLRVGDWVAEAPEEPHE